MLSSTSNSDSRIAETPVGVRWLLVVVLTVVSVALIESGLRVAGYTARHYDTRELWAVQRDGVNRSGADGIALLGNSRMQMAVHPDTLAEYFPGKRVYMLASVGKSPMGLLEDLADDPGFGGTVICAVSMHWIQPELWDDYDADTAYFEQTWPRERWVARLREPLGASVYLSHGSSYGGALDWLEGKSRGRYLELQGDRFKRGYFERLGDGIGAERSRHLVGELGYYGNYPVPSPDELAVTFERTRLVVEHLQARGCRVIFLRLPTSGDLWAYQREMYPKSLYWDRFAKVVSAETYHFADFPELAEIECPDWSHLNFDGALSYTGALGRLTGEVEGR